jgi:hypothetical protein
MITTPQRTMRTGREGLNSSIFVVELTKVIPGEVTKPSAGFWIIRCL